MLLMKKFTKVIALILSLTLLLCFTIGVSAAEAEDTGVDTAAKGSLTVYKVDLTNAKKDGAWDSSYVSTGVYDQIVNDTLTSYALKDVEFTYLRVADVVQVTESAADGADSDHVESLYGISKTAGADFLNALGLGNGVNRYEKADGSDQLDDSKYYYQSDVLISALSTALKANATTVKNALEAYVTESGTAMPLTDTYGKTKAENLELGLYLVVETKVPEMVTSTCNPFFICLPMTSSSGSWIYDVTVYPKNQTGNPTLDKTLRESKDDTGKATIMFNAVLMPPYTEKRFDLINNFFESLDFLPDGTEVQATYPVAKSIPAGYIKELEDRGEANIEKITWIDWAKKRANDNLDFGKMRNLYADVLRAGLTQIHNRLLYEKPIGRPYYNGCCIPGRRRLYVCTDGSYKLCERIGNAPPIGHVDTGINAEVVKQYYLADYERKSIPDCSRCWAINLCDICYAQCYDEKGLNIAMKKKQCANVKERSLELLRDYYELVESKPKLIEEIAKIEVT